MTDDALAQHHERIASLEAELDAARKSAPKENRRAAAEKRVDVLKKQVAGLEKHVAKVARAGIAPLEVRNGTALLFAFLGAATFVVGLVLQLRLIVTPLVWVETKCAIVEHEEDATEAVPELRASASFHHSPMPASKTKVRCYVPDAKLGDGLGRFDPPARKALTVSEKIGRLYAILMLGGLAAVSFLTWLSTERPTED